MCGDDSVRDSDDEEARAGSFYAPVLDLEEGVPEEDMKKASKKLALRHLSMLGAVDMCL